jgi:AcrR family transcriptional regulator
LTPARDALKLLTVLGTPNRDRQAERREATRREVLEAAWELAREVGLASITLRDIAKRVGMQAPSLYTHFASKNAIYDAMFGQAWAEYEQLAQEKVAGLPLDDPRAVVHLASRTFFDFAVADLARYQLMNQRTIPGFEPSPEAYAPAVRVLDQCVAFYRQLGVTAREDVDIWLSLLGGLIDQQLANDPGGDRFSRLLPRAVEMWADGVGLPASRPARREVTTR